jgi:hypothetical protein
MADEELEGLVWDWKEKSEYFVSSSLEYCPAKVPVVGDGRTLEEEKRTGESRRIEGLKEGGKER